MRPNKRLCFGLLWLLIPVGLLALGLNSASAQGLAHPRQQQEEQVIHVVQSGDTLFSIAQQYDSTVEAIAAANDISDPSLISVGQKLVIPAEVGASAVQPETDLGEPSGAPGALPTYSTYVAVPGDTLAALASRLDVTATAIARLNGLVNPADLPPGGALRVPGRHVVRWHRVAPGETALGLALRYDVPLWAFLSRNELPSPHALLPGQRVIIPSQPSTDTLPLPFLALDLGPLPVLQGHTVRLRVDLAPEAQVRGAFDDRALNFAAEEGAHYALVGVHALQEPGFYTVALLATNVGGDEAYLTRTVEIVDGGYGYEEIILSAERDALLDPQALAAERARLDDIRPVFTPERYWDELLMRPITTELTSFFGTRRLYKSPSYQFYGYHEGTDFDGEVGSPVRAPAAGVVVLAEPLFVRGNAIIIDHGWGVHTGYWHLSQINVTVGQRVSPGDLIALVGDTGLSTGAHLHWDFWVNGINVSGLQWTEQPFP